MSYGTYLVPSDTAKVGQDRIKKCQNFGLTLERYAPREAIQETDRHELKPGGKSKSIGKERNFWLQDICGNFQPDGVLVTSVYERWKAMTENAVRFTMVTGSRMIIGLGGKGALEFGITLHPVTGLPYIPGSVLKGLCRNYALYYIAERSGISLDPTKVADVSRVIKQLDEQLTEIEDHHFNVNFDYAALYRKLFGTTGRDQHDDDTHGAGHCVFHDAVVREIPADMPLFAVEVMTPHFRKYYESNGTDAPHDADLPNPITHIAVNAGIPFGFAVGLRKNAPPDTPRVDARTFLKEALQVMGIGAKTAAGYGVFLPPKTKKTS